MPPRPWPAGGIERSGCPYMCPSIGKVKIFVQARISGPINGSKLIFHMRMNLYQTSRNIQEPWPHDLYFTVHCLWTGQIVKVKIFVQGRILSSTNGGKLIYHMRMWGALWDQQEYTRAMTSWPIFHGLLTSDFGQFSMIKIFVIGKLLSSIDGSKLIFY